MRRTILIGALVLLLAMTLLPAAQAVDDGTPDTTHHNVGALILHPFPGQFFLVCSGTLISTTHFLTSAHCLDWADEHGFGADDFVVSFDPDLDGNPSGAVMPDSFLPLSSYAVHPGYGPRDGFWAVNDVAVVTLAAPVPHIAPADLPPLNFLGEAAAGGALNGHRFVNVGYGVDASERGRFSYTFDGVRKVSTSPYKGLTPEFLLLNMQTMATDQGGSCFGDSGSPKFHDERSNLIVATTSGGDPMCRAHNYNVRLDVTPVREFLATFVDLP